MVLSEGLCRFVYYFNTPLDYTNCYIFEMVLDLFIDFYKFIDDSLSL